MEVTRKRDRQVKFRMTEDEYEAFRKLIIKSGMSQQQYLLKVALNKKIINTDGIKEIIPEVKKIGNNLNQIARALNGKRYYKYSLITENQKELMDIWQLLRQYLLEQK